MLPVIEMVYKPRLGGAGGTLTAARLVTVNQSEFLRTTSKHALTGFWYRDLPDDQRLEAFFYNPWEDVAYLAITPTNSRYTDKVLNEFENTYVYRSFDFVRNPPISAVDTASLQDSIVNQLKLWLLIAVGIGAAFLVVRFGFPYLIRFLFPLAIIGAISRIGRKDDS